MTLLIDIIITAVANGIGNGIGLWLATRHLIKPLEARLEKTAPPPTLPAVTPPK